MGAAALVSALAFLTPQPQRATVASPLAGIDPSRAVDHSLMRKLEVHAPNSGRLGTATRDSQGVWTCPVTPARTLVLGGEAGAPVPADAIDMTCAYCAVELVGPESAERLARFCAIDVRPRVMPVGAFRPGSVARTPGYVLRTGDESLLLLVGWALGGYLREVIERA
jgi:hypothetical protein